MITALLSLVVCIVGLLMWFVSSNPKVSEAGRIMFGIGLLVALWFCSGVVVKL